MPEASRTETYDVDKERFFKVLTDYESYPDFVEGVSDVNVVEREGNEALVEYSLNLIKKFKYRLKLKEEAPDKLSWTLESGDIFKSNQGSWILEDAGDGKTKVTYNLDVVFKGFAPKAIVNKLVAKNLPAMMDSYYERAKNL